MCVGEGENGRVLWAPEEDWEKSSRRPALDPLLVRLENQASALTTEPEELGLEEVRWLPRRSCYCLSSTYLLLPRLRMGILGRAVLGIKKEEQREGEMKGKDKSKGEIAAIKWSWRRGP